MFVVLLLLFVSSQFVGVTGSNEENVETFDQLQAIDRYSRDHYEDEDPATGNDGRIDCETDCGGYLETRSKCSQHKTQVNCYTPKGKICCVNTNCHEAGGVCREAPLDGEIELSPKTQCPSGKKCYVKTCDKCKGECLNICPAQTHKESPTKLCQCAEKNKKCCIPIDSCQTNVFWCHDKQCSFGNKCDPPKTIECNDKPCVCPANTKCCEKNCNQNNENEDKCAKQFPGRGKCRSSPECMWDETEVGRPGEFCDNGCICCKKILHCSACNGKCLDNCESAGLVARRTCRCTADGEVCCVKKHVGQGGHELGDPHFETFDGLKFNFHGACTYKLFQDCTDEKKFAVHTEHYSSFNDGHNKTYVLMVWIFVPSAVIELHNTDVKVNGKSVYFSLPVTITDNIEISFNKQRTRVIVDYPGVFTLSWNGNGAVKADLDEAWHGMVCGLLGDANGDEENDLKMLLPDGTLKLTDDVKEFGYSWEVPGSCSKIKRPTKADRPTGQ